MKKKEVRYLSNKEFVRLQKSIQNKRDLLLLFVLYETGCTVSELTKIKIKEIDLVNRKIRFPSESTKSSRVKISFISKYLRDYINDFILRNSSVYLFSTRQSSQITTKRVRQLIQFYSQKIGLGKINPQIIRYTHIAHALDRGLSLNAIQKQVGMERLRMVQIYEALAPEEKEESYEKFWSNQ